AAHDLLAGLVKGIRTVPTQCADDIAVGVASTEFGADAKQCRESSCHEQSAPMIIDLVFESGIAFGVSTRLTFEHNGTAVRKEEGRPDEENAGLPERDLTVVDADQLRSLWD